MSVGETSEYGNTIIVDNEGDGDYTRIQDAIDNATIGDTIEVYSGVYVEDVLIDKPLNLYGIDYELGTGNDEGMPIVMNKDTEITFTLTASGCNISGFDFHENEYAYKGIYIYQSDSNNIFGNSIRSNIGVHLHESNNNNVYDNEFRECNPAIGLRNADYNKIYQNHISYDHGQSIELRYYSENNHIFKNFIENTHGTGIREWKANNNTLSENIITAEVTQPNTVGIALGMDDGVGYGYTIYGNQISNCDKGISISGKLHKIYRNNISNCDRGISISWIGASTPSQQLDIYENNIMNSDEGTGIALYGVFTSNFYKNNITDNRHGIWMEDAESNNFYENNIKYNERRGMHLYNSRDNLIYHNNFIGNDVNAWCDGEQVSRWNTWNLGYTKDGGGNYWDDYSGKDNNDDGVGDTPYVIPDDNPFLLNNKDKYPLMEPDGRPDYRPRNRLFPYTFFMRFLERFPNAFPLLRLILKI